MSAPGEADLAAKAFAEREAAESAARKAVHEESAARLADEKAQAEFEEWKLGAASRKRTADLAAEASRLDNLAKLQGAATSTVPDLKGIERGRTTAPDSVLYATHLMTKALNNAAGSVMRAVKANAGDKYRIFITADPDLLSRDAHLQSLASRLTSLRNQIEEFTTKASGVDDVAVESFAPVLFSAIAAGAKLVPGLLELFAANRSITSAPINVDDGQAVTAVAGALAAAEGDDFLILDDTCLLGPGSQVDMDRGALAEAVVALKGEIAAVQDGIAARGTPATTQEMEWLAAAATLVQAGQDSLVVLDTVPAGAGVSPLVAAMSMELVRRGQLDYILVVQSAGGSATQLISDRPLSMKDPIHIVGSVALSYRLIKRDTSQLVASGVVVGRAELTGTVGSTVEFEERF